MTYSPPPAEPRAATNRNPLGVFAMVLVIVAIVLQFAQSITTGVMMARAEVAYGFYGVVSLAFAIVQGILAVFAVVLGAIALTARDRPKALAGVGVGGGAVILLGVISSLLTSAVLTAFQS